MRSFTAKCAIFSLCAMTIMTGCEVENDPAPVETTAVPPAPTEVIVWEETDVIIENETEAIVTEIESVVTEQTIWLYDYIPTFPDTDFQRFSEAVGDIGDARAFLYANSTGFYSKSKYSWNFVDQQIVLEQNDELEYSFSPVDPEYASTEEELYDRLRSIFTENYISDEELRDTLFTPESHDNQPSYKTIDGILCIKQQYDGVMTQICNDKITILSYNETEANIFTYGIGVADPPSHIFMKLKRSDEGVWQLDKYEQKDYSENEAMFLYNAIELNTDKLNSILSGGMVPENPVIIDVNGSTYVETTLDMNIVQMQEYFKVIFYTDELNREMDLNNYRTGRFLMDEYIKKYIDEVYYEQDGLLFRKADAPRWYLPKIEIDPYADIMSVYIGSGSEKDLFNGNGGFVTCEQPFRNESGEIFSAKVTVCYKRTDDYQGYVYVRIASELPIREITAINQIRI